MAVVLILTLAGMFFTVRPTEAAENGDSQEMIQRENTERRTRAAEKDDSAAFLELHKRFAESPQVAAQWLEAVDDLDLRSRLSDTLGIKWVKVDFTAANEWAESLPDSPILVRSSTDYITSLQRKAYGGMVKGMVQQSLEDETLLENALDFANSLPDSQVSTDPRVHPPGHYRDIILPYRNGLMNGWKDVPDEPRK